MLIIAPVLLGLAFELRELLFGSRLTNVAFTSDLATLNDLSSFCLLLAKVRFLLLDLPS